MQSYGYRPCSACTEQVYAIATEMLGYLLLLSNQNCGRLRKESGIAPQSKDERPLAALLEPMFHAPLSATPASAICSSPHEHLDKMSLTMAHRLLNVDAPASTAFEVNCVPDATNKLRGRRY